MREKWAKLIALFTSLMVLLLAVIFAFIQNPTTSPDKINREAKIPNINLLKSTAIDQLQIEEGHQVYKKQTCARCHSIAGKGNLRNPLDNVGSRHTSDELRDWIIGEDRLKGSVSESILKLKKTYRSLSDHDLDLLVIYLQNPK